MRHEEPIRTPWCEGEQRSPRARAATPGVQEGGLPGGGAIPAAPPQQAWKQRGGNSCPHSPSTSHWCLQLAKPQRKLDTLNSSPEVGEARMTQRALGRWEGNQPQNSPPWLLALAYPNPAVATNWEASQQIHDISYSAFQRDVRDLSSQHLDWDY